MRCHDCPEIDNGTRKRQICCLREGRAAREAEFIRKLPPMIPIARGVRVVRVNATASTLLSSGMAVHHQWTGRK